MFSAMVWVGRQCRHLERVFICVIVIIVFLPCHGHVAVGVVLADISSGSIGGVHGFGKKTGSQPHQASLRLGTQGHVARQDHKRRIVI